MSTSRAFVTKNSDSASRADVASSSSSIFGLSRIARAMATLCFWPPLSCTPLSPTKVSYPSGNLSMKPAQLACWAALFICSSLTESFSTPYRMFSRMEHAKREGS
mmetsp:Transcript_25815/g.36045  ORF Transcript_25815/g.36045 Transcript_25815/m.36045 type:complete len:105 (-) Transcript_25815:1792-2106(-)